MKDRVTRRGLLRLGAGGVLAGAASLLLPRTLAADVEIDGLLEETDLVLGELQTIADELDERSAVQMVELAAGNNPNIIVWLNSEDVSKECNRCLVPVEQGIEAWGWVDMIIYTQPSTLAPNFDHLRLYHLLLDANGDVVTKRVWGTVGWESI